MPFTIQDFEDLIRILEERPEWLARMRQVVLTHDLLELPALVQRLAETQERFYNEFAEYRRITDQRIAELTASVQHLSEEFAEYRRITDQRLAELTASVQRLSDEFAEYRRITDQRIAELTASVQHLSEEFAEYRRITDQRIAELAEAQRRTEQQVAELTTTVERLSEEFAEYRRITDQRIAELAEAQRRTEQQVASLTTQVAELTAIMREMVRRLERLEDWQRGEAGRRDGERFERQTIARAPALFYGGTGGGMGEPHIREKLGKWLAPLYQQGIDIDKHDDPLLADLIWWKGDRVMVTEISLKVDAQDVQRAVARARTLRQVGIDATPVVIGEEWATPDTQALAQQEGVEWMVGGGLSQGFLQFRKILSEELEAS